MIITKKTLWAFLTVFILAFTACSTNHSVTNGGLVQKRKYNKGYYLRMFEQKNANTANNTAQNSSPQVKVYEGEKVIVESPADVNFEAPADEFASTEIAGTSVTPELTSTGINLNDYSEPAVSTKKISAKRRNRMLQNTNDEPKPEKDKMNVAALVGFIVLIITYLASAPFLSFAMWAHWSFALVPIVLFLIAFALGIIGLRKTKKGRTKGYGLAFTTVLLGSIVVGITLISLFGLYVLPLLGV